MTHSIQRTIIFFHGNILLIFYRSNNKRFVVIKKHLLVFELITHNTILGSYIFYVQLNYLLNPKLIASHGTSYVQ